MGIERIISAMCGDVWVIDPDKLEAICEVLNVRLAGGFRSDSEIQAAVAQAKENVSTRYKSAAGGRVDTTGGNVAVLTLYGTLAQRCGCWDSGAVSVERFGKNFDAAMNDPSVGSIVIDIDSPGGSVFGIEEMAERIYSARGRKNVVAVANSWAASGAYWIAAAANSIVVTLGGEVGSIGVFCIHQDLSNAYQQIGVKHTIIKAGKHKAEATPFEELDPAAKQYIQERVSETYDVFVKAVAKFRGVKVAEVKENFGQGRMKMGKAAVKSSMADSIGTLDSVIAGLLKNKNKSFGSKAASESDLTETILNDQGDQTMADDTKKTAEASVDIDAVTAAVNKAATTAQTERVSALQAAFPDDAKFAMEQVVAGASVQEAKAAYCDVLAGRLKDETSKKPPEKPATGKTKNGADPIAAGGAAAEGGAGTFTEQAKAKAAADGTTFRVAASALSREQTARRRE